MISESDGPSEKYHRFGLIFIFRQVIGNRSVQPENKDIILNITINYTIKRSSFISKCFEIHESSSVSWSWNV